MSNVFDELDDRTKEPSGGDNYADWWEPDESGNEQIVGLIVEQHSSPEDWTEVGEVPETIHTVLSLGRGDFEEGALVTPKLHKQLIRGLSDGEIGDLVNLKFTGYQKIEGNMMHTYEVGIIQQDEWKELDGSDEIQESWDNHIARGILDGDNRRTEPYRTVSESDNSDTSNTDDELIEAGDFLKNFVALQNGSVDLGKAEKMFTEVRKYDVSVQDAADVSGLTVTDDEVKNA